MTAARSFHCIPGWCLARDHHQHPLNGTYGLSDLWKTQSSPPRMQIRLTCRYVLSPCWLIKQWHKQRLKNNCIKKMNIAYYCLGTWVCALLYKLAILTAIFDLKRHIYYLVYAPIEIDMLGINAIWLLAEKNKFYQKFNRQQANSENWGPTLQGLIGSGIRKVLSLWIPTWNVKALQLTVRMLLLRSFFFLNIVER